MHSQTVFGGLFSTEFKKKIFFFLFLENLFTAPHSTAQTIGQKSYVMQLNNFKSKNALECSTLYYNVQYFLKIFFFLYATQLGMMYCRLLETLKKKERKTFGQRIDHV